MPDKLGPVPGQLGGGGQLMTQPPTASRELIPFRVQNTPKIPPCTASCEHPHFSKGKFHGATCREGWAGPGLLPQSRKVFGCWALCGCRRPLWIVSRREPHVGRATVGGSSAERPGSACGCCMDWDCRRRQEAGPWPWDLSDCTVLPLTRQGYPSQRSASQQRQAVGGTHGERGAGSRDLRARLESPLCPDVPRGALDK